MTLSTLAPVLSPAQLAEVLPLVPDTRLLDVRTPGEYETAHIAGSYNVPVDTLAEYAREIRTVSAPVVLVCQSGQRARRAEGALRAAGMTNVHVLDGGVNAWLAAGQPVVRGPRRLSLERQVRIVAGALAATGGLLALLVDPRFALLPAFIGSGLVFAGLTDTCGMAMLLSRLPYNRPARCDVPAMVRAFATAAPPVPVGRAPASEAPGANCCSAA
ncbi:MAG TPA: rhodanese-like domain-containing protein [Gemmatimonadales bacterium]|nr:rhodanese-like domain-containing protein [Gemmatimonadales bacterium]